MNIRAFQKKIRRMPGDVRHVISLKRSSGLAFSMAMIMALSACTQFLGGPGINTAQTGAGQAVPAGTSPEDAVIGRRENPAILNNYGGIYSSRRAEIMLAQVVSRLLVAARQPETSFKITILNSPEVNAFALPGGYIYVTRGILALANDTSEIAAVLAHEIAHVTLRHARARTNRVATSQLVDRVIEGLFGTNADNDQGVSRSRVSLAAFSQAQELSADSEGVKIAARAGFDSTAAARFLGAMSRFSSFRSGEEDQGDDFLATHPSAPDRIQRALETAQSINGPEVVQNDRDGYLLAIRGLAFGDSPEQGAIVGAQFIHPQLKFTFSVPARYTLQNSRDAVVGVAGDGEAVRFDSASVPADMDLQEYLKSGWIAGLQPETVRAESYNGVEMASGSAKTDDWVFRVTALRFEGEVYRFIFASRNQTEAFSSAALQTIKSFRASNGNDLGKIREVKVDLVRARAGDNADALAARMRMLPDGETLFFLINNLFAGDDVQAGQFYKIVTVR